MTQKVSFTKEMIVKAAFSLTREQGWASVTARNVAQKLGSSTMPIYSSLKSMDEIEQKVRGEAERLMQEYQKKPYSENEALNIAIGYVTFARNEPNLFRFLYVEQPVTIGQQDAEHPSEGFFQSFGTEGGVRNSMAEISKAVLDPLMLKSWIFTHGLASMISAGVMTLSEEKIQSLLLEAGGAFYLWDQNQAAAGKNAKEKTDE
jgi:AcrR family transcriptional regulator